ncbi:MAG: DUF5011 domain-containing protein [Nitrosopumilus sp.]|uniref:immunoglobulin-like domain-containing protein n=1 Tax=Nitrosopumilus sp. TaxID=2024843 RepID=UPI00246C329F|nr:immunoglobulin-like domain-containing protein [Nitrosopumilus sp.]MDH5431111.1 DUF5011 domain-containing protein [Nitrosopumilus sp.]
MTLTKKLATSITMFALLAVFAAPAVSFADHGSNQHVINAVAFDDANLNGIFDCNESGIQGVTILVLDSGDTVIEIQTTNVDGAIAVPGIVDGSYGLQISVSPQGVTFAENKQTFVVNSDVTIYFGSPSGTEAASCDGDITPPVITLNGPNPQELIVNQIYEEFEATVTDDSGEDLSGALVIDSSAVKIAHAGTYQVSYNVMDSSLNEADTVYRTVTVLTQQQALDNIEQEINDAITNGEIGNNANGLLSKLDQIMNKLDSNNTNAACNQLNAFINQVDGLITSGDLTSEVGQPILDAAIGIQSNYC